MGTITIWCIHGTRKKDRIMRLLLAGWTKIDIKFRFFLGAKQLMHLYLLSYLFRVLKINKK